MRCWLRRCIENSIAIIPKLSADKPLVDYNETRLHDSTTGNNVTAWRRRESINGDNWIQSNYGINSLGQAVGNSAVGVHPGQQYQDYHAFIWEPAAPNGMVGAMVDLNALLDPMSSAGWTITNARGINDLGQIVGIGLYRPDGPNGRLFVRGVLLTPIIPESSSYLLLATGTALIVCALRNSKPRGHMR